MKKNSLFLLVLLCYNLTSFSQETKNLDDSSEEVPTTIIVKPPVYRGCSPDAPNEIIKKCTEKKIANFIKMSIDTQLASKLFPTQRSTQVKVEFTISKKGKIKDITAKAHHRSMAIEVINVAKRVPKLKAPGYIEDKAVDTPFSMLLTIYFN